MSKILGLTSLRLSFSFPCLYALFDGVTMIIQLGKKLLCELNLNCRFLSTQILPFMLSWCRILDLKQGFEQKRVRGLLPKTGNQKVLHCAHRNLELRFLAPVGPAACTSLGGDGRLGSHTSLLVTRPSASTCDPASQLSGFQDDL